MTSLKLCSLILICACSAVARALEHEGSAVISGKVTVDGKPASGVVLILSRIRTNEPMEDRMMQGSQIIKTTTDSGGHYQFSRLEEGTYAVHQYSPSLTVEGRLKGMDSIALGEGEAVDGMDFDLKTGAVITGAVTASDGRPIIGLNVNARPDTPNDHSDGQAGNTAGYGTARTDDRGVYRIFGLPPGRYRVETGASGPSFMSGSSGGTTAAYHDRNDPSKPGVVTLAAGSEATGIDMRLAPPEPTFEATGRVIDDSGRAVPSISLICEGEGRHTSLFGGESMGPQTNEMGEFKIRGLKSGSYTLAPFMLFASDNQFYGEPVKFEIKGGNASGIEIKVHKGMTASGQVVLEGADDPQILGRLYEHQIMGATEGEARETFSLSKSSIGPGGEFALHGLAPGKLHLIFGDILQQSAFQISRVELNGAPLNEGVTVEPGQDVTGLKIVVLYANCSLHGRVRVTGGKLEKGTTLVVSVTRTNPDMERGGDLIEGRRRSGPDTAYLEPSGNFKIEGLTPGDYQITVQMLAQDTGNAGGGPTTRTVAQQTITLAGGQDAEVDLTVDVTAPIAGEK